MNGVQKKTVLARDVKENGSRARDFSLQGTHRYDKRTDAIDRYP